MRNQRWLGVNVPPAFGYGYTPGTVQSIYYPNPALAVSVPLASSSTPTGTYTQSCQNIVYDAATDTLTALCETENGTWQQSTLFQANGGYVAGSIFNNNGQLGGQPLSNVATPVTTQQPNIVAPDVTPPPGGYQQIEAPGSPYVYVGQGPAPIPPNTPPSYLPPNYSYGTTYGSTGGGLTAAQQLAIANLSAASGGSSAGSSFTNFWNNYKVPILLGLAGLIVVPPLLKRITR